MPANRALSDCPVTISNAVSVLKMNVSERISGRPHEGVDRWCARHTIRVVRMARIERRFHGRAVERCSKGHPFVRSLVLNVLKNNGNPEIFSLFDSIAQAKMCQLTCLIGGCEARSAVVPVPRRKWAVNNHEATIPAIGNDPASLNTGIKASFGNRADFRVAHIEVEALIWPMNPQATPMAIKGFSGALGLHAPVAQKRFRAVKVLNFDIAMTVEYEFAQALNAGQVIEIEGDAEHW